MLFNHTFIFRSVLFACLFVFFGACRQEADRTRVEKEIADAFQKETGYAAKEVVLIRKADHFYTGSVTLQKDNSKALIEVSVDKDDPSRYAWKMTEPSSTMLKDEANRRLEYVTVSGEEQLEGTADTSLPAQRP